MAKEIASLYEIHEKIGSGGGGVVYLGLHKRLGKKVVLKADERTLSAKPESLRREVDALKNLSHTYIPNVYDYVEEDGVVYTVMDYIEGESLDKPLQRGERFSQATVVEWACQLLEALCYLHSRPPHGILHSDIKPANIMLTPQNDIRLIDFNIALALGESGAVRVGYSQGYASPEHYGMEFVRTRSDTNHPSACKTTLREESVEKSGSPSSGSERRGILLDVRSDIYSLGATLYHLLTGRHPERNAKDVKPITAFGVSPAVARIIQKAMEPNPDDRYQRAEEMLYAFEHLHETDPRTKRYKRMVRGTAAVLILLFLAGGAMAFTGQGQMERTQNAYALAEYSANALRSGDVSGAVDYALEALPENRGLLDPPYVPQAQRALANALGVYDLSDGFKPHNVISLAAAPLKLAISPEGTGLAAMLQGQALIFDAESGETLAELPADASALSDVVFADEDTVFYAGEGALQAYSIENGTELWSGQPATAIALSGDGTIVAGVYKEEQKATVYHAKTGEVVKTVDFQGKCQSVAVNDIFADPEDNLLTLSQDGRWLAVSFSDGALWVYDLETEDNDIEIYDVSDYTHFEGGFFGSYFAFVSTAAEDSVFAVVDVENMVQTGGFSSTLPFHTNADESGIYVATEDILVKIHPETGEQTEVAYTNGADIVTFARSDAYTMVTTADGVLSFFDSEAVLLEQYTSEERCDFAALAGPFVVSGNRDTPALRVMKLENHADAQLFSYEKTYPHSEARISADGQTVMLFRYDGFRLYDIDGTLLAEVSIPDAEEVYDQQYRRNENGSYLEVIYNNGMIRTYSAVDGSLLSEVAGEVPDDTLYEEFWTDSLRITGPLHGTPAAYDLESGELIKELEPDAYLTYVTQVGDQIVTEYISAEGVRYALLLDENCETLADLPNLCDILPDGTLVFDDMKGNLRTSRIYSIQELITLGKQ